MQDEDIPLLTEVHTASHNVTKQVHVTAYLIAEIANKIQPQLTLKL